MFRPSSWLFVLASCGVHRSELHTWDEPGDPAVARRPFRR